VAKAVLRCAGTALLASLAVACSPGDTRLEARFAPGFPAPRQAVSILGVYKDGRMNPEAWGGISPQVTRAFGGGVCEVAFSESFESAHADLAAAIDDYTRASGPTDDLIGELAPSARGDVVLVVTLAGHAVEHHKISLPAEEAKKGAHHSKVGQGRPDPLDVVAVFFSVRDPRPVGSMTLEYTGTSATEALTRFTAALSAAWPQATCAGWNWDAAAATTDRVHRLSLDR